MRKLGETFEDRYRFKRLLKTDPAIIQRYKKHEDAVNSVTPVREATIFDQDELLCVSPIGSVPFEAVSSACQRITPYDREWPRRVIFAEQIPDLHKHRCPVWVVLIEGPYPKYSSHDSYEWQGQPRVDVIRLDQPTVVFLYPSSPYKHTTAVNTETLSRIDSNEFATYFLEGRRHDSSSDPIPLDDCGLVPSGSKLLNTTFYDQTVAKLYAESICKHLTLLSAHFSNNGS